MHNLADIIVVGQGVVGLSAAIAMRDLGFSVINLDANHEFTQNKSTISRIYAINNASIELFKKINVWRHLTKTQISAYNRMHVWEAKYGAEIEFDSRICASDKLGVMLEEADLKQALFKEASTKEILFINNYQVENVIDDENKITVYNSQNEALSAKLLIIADGAKSSLRDKLGVKITTWPYNQNAIIANVSTTKSHNQTAYQVFTEDGPLAFLPQNDNLHCSIVWSVPPEKAKTLINDNEKIFTDKINNVFNNKLGEITLKSERYQFPLQMRHTQQYSGKHWVLMGDAAHTIHPLAGLGLNVGLADLSTWIFELKKNNLTLTADKALKSYQRQRKHALWQIIALMQTLHVLFTQKTPIIAKITSLGLNILNNLTPLKRLIIQQASGSKL